MTNAVDTHDSTLIGDLVNHPIIAYADTPVVLAAGQFAAAGRSWIIRERLDRRNDTVMNLGREPRQVFFRGALKQDPIHGSLAATPGEVIFQRSVVKRLAPRAIEPGEIASVFQPLQKFFVILDRDDDGNGFAFARHDFRFR